jgi:hypothetical protein
MRMMVGLTGSMTVRVLSPYLPTLRFGTADDSHGRLLNIFLSYVGPNGRLR